MTDVLLVGVGGYGRFYLEECLKKETEDKLKIAGVIDPFISEDTLKLIKERDIKQFASLEEFYQTGNADLVTIASPIQFHKDQTCTALRHGSHVLCEKPIAATNEDVLEMIEESDRSGKQVGIGYQWAFAKAILELKKDILDGKFGKPIKLKSMVLWPRNKQYYQRSWAGKVKDESGRWVLDSVAANATTHYLQNMFFILGKKIEDSQLPVKIVAETYRANTIENYDTSIIRTSTEDGVDILFVASHAIQKKDEYGPAFEYVFEDAIITFNENVQDRSFGRATIKATFHDGRVIDYGSPFDDSFNKLDVMLDIASNKETLLPCTLETASAQSLSIAGVQQSVPNPVTFPAEVINYDENDEIVWVDGLSDVLKECYNEWKMPHELDVSWSQCGETISLNDNTLYKLVDGKLKNKI